MLSEEQKTQVAGWFAAGASLDEIQKRVKAEFGIHMTYLDVRLMVAELPQPVEPESPRAPEAGAQPGSEGCAPVPGAQAGEDGVRSDSHGCAPAPGVRSDSHGCAPAPGVQSDSHGCVPAPGARSDSHGCAPAPGAQDGDLPPGAPKRYDLDAPDADEGKPIPDVLVEMDALTIPGTYASGDVTFSDGVKGKWYLDQQGRLGLGNAPEGYRPSPTDAAIFQSRLMELLRERGMM